MSIISVDFFGTLDVFTGTLLPFLEEIRELNHDVVILTGAFAEEIETDLHIFNIKKGVHYDEIFSVMSYIEQHGYDMHFNETTQSHWADPKIFWSAKAEICRRARIITHIDNDDRFEGFFRGTITRFLKTEEILNDISILVEKLQYGWPSRMAPSKATQNK